MVEAKLSQQKHLPLNRKRLRIDPLFAAVLALALPILLLTPLLSGELPGTHDAQLHLHRLVSAALNWREGVVWGRWAPQLHHGYGYPIGNFYAPGWHVAGGLFVSLGAPAVSVWLAAQTAGIVLYAAGGWVWGREIGGRMGGLLAAAAFLYAPLRFFELFAQGNLSQFLAMGLIPFALWGLARCARAPSVRSAALAGLLIAAVIVTHHPTAALFVPTAAAYALAAPFIARAKPWASLAALAFGMLVSAVYWLPAGLETRYVALEGAANQYPYAEAFIPFNELFALGGPDRAALNQPWTLSAGLPQSLFVLAGAALAMWPRLALTRWQRLHALGGALLFAVCLFLTTDASAPLWERLPLSRFILYPWRFLGIAAAAVIPCAALLGALRLPRAAYAGVLPLTIAAALPAMTPLYPNARIEQPVTPGTSVRYEIASGNLGAVATAEYTPRGVVERPMRDPAPEFYDDWRWNIRVLDETLPPGVEVSSEDGTRPTETRFTITAPEAFTLTLHQFAFPGWAAELDGEPVAIDTHQTQGLMQVTVPAGTRVLSVRYAGTPEQHAAELISGLTLLACLAALVWRRKGRPEPESALSEPREMRFGLVTAGALIAFGTVYAVLQPALPIDSGRSPTVQTPLGGRFVDADGQPLIELIGLSTSTGARIRPGEWIYVDLYWRALRPLTADWTAVLDLRDATGQIVWAQSRVGAPGGFNTQRWPSGRYVRDRRILRVRPDGEPYVAGLALRLEGDAGELRYDGPPLPSVRILSDACPAPSGESATRVQFGDALALTAYRLDLSGDDAVLDLAWTTLRDAPGDLALFIHFMADGALLEAADRAPIDAYPAPLWLDDQCLTHRSMLPVPPGADRLLVGFYDRATGARLPAAGSAPLESDGVVIEIGQ